MSHLLLLSIPIVLYCCSGALDAFMDTIKDHWSTFVWRDKVNAQFWNPAISWTNKYIDNDPTKGHKTFKLLWITFNTFDELSDVWHRLKILREGCNILAILCTQFAVTPIPIAWWIYIIEGLILAIARNKNFSLFYNKLLVK